MNDHAVARPSRLSTRQDDGVGLGDLISLLWRARIRVICITVGFAVIAYGIAWLFPRKYEATILLEPVNRNSDQSALSSAISQFSGLAALAGLSGANHGMTAVELATLQSRVLTESFIKRYDLLPVLFPKEWDARTRTWRSRKSGHVPTLWEADALFAKGIRDVSTDTKTGLVTLTITWTDPVRAAEWANELVAMTNSYMRDIAIKQANAEMAYLQDQALKTNTVEMKTTIYALMERELQKAMVAAGEQQFALRVIDPAEPPELPSSPKHLLWAFAGLIFGFFIAASYVVANAIRAEE